MRIARVQSKPSRAGLMPARRPQRSAVSAAQRDSALLDFTQFSIKKKIQFSAVRPDSREGVRGVYATFPVTKGSTLVAVPRDAALVVGPSEPSPSANMPNSVWSSLPWFAQLAIKLSLEKAAGPASGLAEFIRALPQEPVDLPVLWSDEDLARLQYPHLQARITQERQQWQEIQAALASSLKRLGIDDSTFVWAMTCIRSRSFAGPSFKSPVKLKLALFAVLQAAALGLALTGSPGWASGVAEALAIAMPAAWAAADAKDVGVEYAVCPFIDFFNHSSLSRAECQYDWLRDSYQVVSDRDFRVGEQVLINYGSQSNDQLLQLYGFVEPANPDERFVVTRLPEFLLEGPLAGLKGREWLQQQIQARLSSELQEVVLTSRGFDDRVSALIKSLVAKADASAATGLDAQLQTILADVCKRELAACGSTLDDDVQALDDLRSNVAIALRPLPPLPTLPLETLEPPAEPQLAELAEAEASSSGIPGGDDGSSPQASYLSSNSEGSRQTPGSEEARGDASPSEQATVAEHIQMSPEEVDSVLKSFPRQQTILQFRIEKKKLLHKLAGAN